MTTLTIGADGNRATASRRCYGTDDEATIVTAGEGLVAGDTLKLTTGVFTITGDIRLPPGVNLAGSGPGTILRCDQAYPRTIVAPGGQTLSDFTVEGSGIVEVQGSNTTMRRVTTRATKCWDSAVVVRALDDMTNVKFEYCDAIDTDCVGFVVVASDPVGTTISNLQFTGCKAIRCGHAPGRYIPRGDVSSWVVGFDLEHANVVDSEFYRCYAERCWESGFHAEWDHTYTNVRFRQCRSMFNGVKKLVEDPTKAFYIAGYCFPGGITATDCVAQGNAYGYLTGNGPTGTAGTVRQSMEIGSTQYGFIVSKGSRNAVIDRCTTMDSTSVPVLAQENTGLRVTTLKRIRSSVPVRVTGTNNVVTYAT